MTTPNLLAAVGLLLLSVLVPAAASIPGPQPNAGIPLPENPQQPGCRLCMNPPANVPGNDLELVFVNSGEYWNLELKRDTPPGIIDLSLGVTMRSVLGDREQGCTVQNNSEGVGYGRFAGTIIPGENHMPSPEPLEREYCQSCRAAILEASPGYDLLLLDLAGRHLYGLCEAPYAFEIRNYRILTNHRWDGSITLTVTDTTIYQRGQPE